MKFGTDGVRGPAADFTDSFTSRLGRAAGRVLPASAPSAFIVGMDTRRSGPEIAEALVAGLVAEGHEPRVLGVVPTPAVAYASAVLGAPGAMISASHNPYTDNGVKFFAPGGRKLPDEVEARLETELAAVEAPVSRRHALPDVEEDLVAGYVEDLAAHVEGDRLRGLRVVLDCANGSASELSPSVLQQLGADVEVIHAQPDGRNINDGCGSTHPEDLSRAVVASHAAVGLAFDGDADRVLAVDERGVVVDGDQLIAMCALDLRDRGLLAKDTVVVTVMTNLGFRQAMADAGIHVVETAVGDRYVLEALEAGGYSLGGEQSGHLIFADRATTGDGLLAGLTVLDLLARSGRPLSALADVMTRLPQVLVNVSVRERDPAIAEHLEPVIRREAETLGDHGRVLVRPSGTEPLVRVMVEAPTEAAARACADRLAAAVRERSEAG